MATTEVTTVTEVSTAPKSKWSEWNEKIGIVKFVGGIIVVLAIGWSATQITSASQTFAISELNRKYEEMDTRVERQNATWDKQLTLLREEMVRKDLFNERTGAILTLIQGIRDDNKQTKEDYDKLLRQPYR